MPRLFPKLFPIFEKVTSQFLRTPGHTLLIFPCELFYFYETSAKFYDQVYFENLKTQSKTPAGLCTSHLKGVASFLSEMKRFEIHPVFVLKDFDWLLKMNREPANFREKESAGLGSGESPTPLPHIRSRYNIQSYLRKAVTFSREDIENGIQLIRWMGCPIYVPRTGSGEKLAAELSQSTPDSSVFSTCSSVLKFDPTGLTYPAQMRKLFLQHLPTARFRDLYQLSNEQFAEASILIEALEERGIRDPTTKKVRALLSENVKSRVPFFDEIRKSDTRMDWEALETQKRKCLDPEKTQWDLLPAEDLSTDELRHRLGRLMPDIIPNDYRLNYIHIKHDLVTEGGKTSFNRQKISVAGSMSPENLTTSQTQSFQ